MANVEKLCIISLSKEYGGLNMKNVKRKVSLLLVSLLVICSVMGIVGCSSTKETSITTTNAASVEASQVAKLDKATIYVFIAASLKNSMTTIQEMYSKVQPNVTIVLNPDSSGTLKTQIDEGATCDIFFSAAMKQMNDLNTEGFIDTTSITKVLENQVVLIKPKGGATLVTSFDTITKAKNIALAGEDVPVGAYAREIFKSLGIYDKVMAMEINQGANVTAVLAAVSEGSNEVGVVYATDAASVASKIDIIASAPSGSLTTPVVYPVGLVKNKDASAAQTAAAKDFISYLQKDEVTSIFTGYGFSKAK